MKNTYKEVHFKKSCWFLASNFTKNEFPYSYLSRILTADYWNLIFYSNTCWLLLNKINQFYWMALLTAIITSCWLLIVQNHCHWSCNFHNHNGIHHQCLHDDHLPFPELYHHGNYTWSILSFSGQMTPAVLGDISPSNYLTLNVLSLRTQLQCLSWKFEGFAIVALFHILQMYFVHLIFSLTTQEHSGNEVLSIFFTQEISAPLVFGLYFFMNIWKRYHLPNLVVSSHLFHRQVLQCLLFTYW